MQSKSPVEIADRMSRTRALIVAIATFVFLAIQFLTRPFFGTDPESASHLTRQVMWAVNAGVLLLLLGTGGGLLNNRQIRALINDEVSRANYRTSAVTGFWVAMATAFAVYLVPAFESFTARETIYVVVTATVVVSLLLFAYLEHRAHRDA
jgi:hypothetical protein